MSNFLGDPNATSRRSMVISHAEVLMREQQGIQKNMNYRDDGRPSVFLISDRGEEHTDEWHEKEQLLVVEGHDATTKPNKKNADQELTHESGALSDNGKFYREANNFKDGVRKEAMRIQVYEWLDSGVWYDKGICSLVDAQRHMKNKRRIFTFVLSPLFGGADENYKRERLIPAKVKQAVWERDLGRCAVCGSDGHLFFETMQSASDGGLNETDNVSLRCASHASGARTGFL